MPGWLGSAGCGLLAETGLPGLDAGPVGRRGAAESVQVAYLGERTAVGCGQGPRAPLDAQPTRDQLSLEAELAQVGQAGGLLVDQQAGGTIGKAGRHSDLVGVELHVAD